MTKIIDSRRGHNTDSSTAYIQSFNIELQRLLPNQKRLTKTVPLPRLSAANLPFGNRLDPAQRQINANRHNANNPKHLRVILAIIPKNDGKHDTPQIPRRARAATDDTISMGVRMRHQGEVRAVAGFQEEGHAGDESEHGVFIVWVQDTDDDEEDARDDADEVDPGLLAPDIAVAVDDVGYDAAGGAESDVE